MTLTRIAKKNKRISSMNYNSILYPGVKNKTLGPRREADESTEKGFLEILTEIKWVEKRWVDTRYEIEKGKEIEVPSKAN